MKNASNPTSRVADEQCHRNCDFTSSIYIATYVPGSLETRTLDPLQASAPLPIFEEQRALEASLTIKCALIRVCREWRVLATPIGWCHEGRKGCCVCTAHCLRTPRDPRCVRRLFVVVVLRETHGLSGNARYDLDHPAEVTAALPNLAIFTPLGVRNSNMSRLMPIHDLSKQAGQGQGGATLCIRI